MGAIGAIAPLAELQPFRTDHPRHDLVTESIRHPLAEGWVRLTFVRAPKFHVSLHIPGLIEHLQSSRKRQVVVSFHLECKRREFSLIRVQSVDGLAVETNAHNMMMETDNVTRGDPGPFPGACWY